MPAESLFRVRLGLACPAPNTTALRGEADQIDQKADNEFEYWLGAGERASGAHFRGVGVVTSRYQLPPLNPPRPTVVAV